MLRVSIKFNVKKTRKHSSKMRAAYSEVQCIVGNDQKNMTESITFPPLAVMFLTTYVSMHRDVT